MREGIYRLLIVLVVFVLPLLYLFQQALFDPAIEFLPPSFSAAWTFHPVQEILRPQGNPISHDVAFKRTFRLDRIPERFPFQAKAFRKMSLRVNGVEVPLPSPGNWKASVRGDLAGYLQAGENTILIRVANEGAIPGLLVESSPLRTPQNWHAALGPAFEIFQPVVSALQTGPREPLASQVKIGADPGPLQRWEGWKLLRWLIPAWLFFLAAAAVWILWQHVKPAQGEKESGGHLNRKPGFAVPILILAASSLLNIWNAAHYPYDRTNLDASAHVEYIQYLARRGEVPTAREGFEMFQPPLYYSCAAVIYRLAGGDSRPLQALKFIQFLGVSAGVGLSLLSWMFARRLFPHRPNDQSIALLFASFLPMSLYMNPLITNEVFSATVIAAAIYALVVVAERWSVRSAFVAGFLAGLALLSKYTAVFAFTAGALYIAIQLLSGKRRGAGKLLLAYAIPALLIAGWFYWRNFSLFGDPFIGNWDQLSGFRYEQNPGYRTAGFYLRFGSAFFHHPERSTFLSWLDGNYASMWADVYRNFVNEGDQRSYFWIGVMLLLAILPTQTMLLGFGETLLSALRRPVSNPDFVLAAVPLWTWMSLVLFSMELPFVSAIKAFFFLSLVPILGIYLIRGRKLLSVFLPWMRPLLDTSLIALAAMAFWLYAYYYR